MVILPVLWLKPKTLTHHTLLETLVLRLIATLRTAIVRLSQVAVLFKAGLDKSLLVSTIAASERYSRTCYCCVSIVSVWKDVGDDEEA
jgi:hypothetical protein